jgi:CBS domain-containing protein
MKVKDCCTKNVLYVAPQTTIAEVAKLMKDNECGSILVGENDKLTGMITDRDIVLRCVADSQDPASMTADQCMTPGVLYCYDNNEPEEILKNMAKNKVGRMPVVDSDKKLVGIVTFGKLATACTDKDVTVEAVEEIRSVA